MKITPEHYRALKSGINKIKEIAPTVTPEYYREKQIGKNTDKRFRWDVFRCARNNMFFDLNLIDEIYKYANDDHIDTALRKIVKELY